MGGVRAQELCADIPYLVSTRTWLLIVFFLCFSACYSEGSRLAAQGNGAADGGLQLSSPPRRRLSLGRDVLFPSEGVRAEVRQKASLEAPKKSLPTDQVRTGLGRLV